MKKFSKEIFILLALFCLCQTQAFVPPTGFTAPEFDLDIDSPYSTRYEAMYSTMCPPLELSITQLIEKLTTVVKLKIISETIYFLISNTMGLFSKLITDQDTQIFIQNIATKCKLTHGQVTLSNFTYDILGYLEKKKSQPEESRVKKFFKMCTSVIFQENNSETQVLGSNLDYTAKSILKNLIFQANYYKDKKLVAKTQEVFGSKGCLRIISYGGKFAASQNQRYYDKSSDSLFKGLWQKRQNPMHILLEVGLNGSSYDQSKEMLEKAMLLSPVYYTLIGKSKKTGKLDGCVFERNNGEKIDAKYCLNENADGDDWFLAQTNYDRDCPDPEHDYRRIPIENGIEKIGRKDILSTDLDRILQRPPNYRVGETLTTTIITFKLDEDDQISDSAIKNTVWN